MVVSVWLIAVDGGDRIYTTTKPPTLKLGPNDKVFRTDIYLPGFRDVDGVVQATASLEGDLGIRLPSSKELVDSRR
jgi:hypothetical protein